ncbi:MAG TPA: hypothetical protein VF787_03270 [Thermoanaerobaculia bacterium]
MADSAHVSASAAAPSSAATSQSAAQSSASQAPVSSAASASSAAASSSAAVSASSAATSKAPDKYEFKLPAGEKVDPAVVERTTAIARELGLSNDAGQKLLDATLAEIKTVNAAQVEANKPGGTRWSETQAQWKADALKDAEIGGTEEKLANSVELAQKVLAQFGGPATAKFLNESGLGSHPEAIRLLSKIGAAMSESTLILAPSSQKPGKLPPKTAMYGEDGTGAAKKE